MQTATIRQTIHFKASPEALFDIFFNKKKYGALTGEEVVVSKKIGGKFSVFGGYCTGKNLEIIANQLIIQTWNFVEEGWPEDHYSTCTFQFEKIASGCKLHFKQESIPAHCAAALKIGWKKYYWNPLKTLFA